MFNYFCIFFDSFHYFSSIVSMIAFLLQFGIIYFYLNLLFIILIYYYLLFVFFPGLILIPPDVLIISMILGIPPNDSHVMRNMMVRQQVNRLNEAK
jgi:hypothetical protein